jgi:hypothetical protein
MTSHLHLRAAALIAAALLIAGCGGGGGGAEPAPPAPPPTAPAPPPPPAAPAPTSLTSFVREQLTQAEAAEEPVSINEQEWVIDDEETSFDDLLQAAGG